MSDKAPKAKEPVVCKHHLVHIETKQEYNSSGYGEYIRRDIFYCDKCAEIIVKRKRHDINQEGRYAPDWYTGPVLLSNR